MESTAQYWRPVWMALEASSRSLWHRRAQPAHRVGVSGIRPMHSGLQNDPVWRSDGQLRAVSGATRLAIAESDAGRDA